MNKYLIIVRGIPGSGKSYTVQNRIDQILKENPYGDYSICSTDDFWGNEYRFNPRWLSEAHAWNFAQFTRDVFMNISYIFIDNTNIRYDHFEKYIEFAVKHGYKFTLLESDAPWKFDTEECFKRNTHNVPKEVIGRMNRAFESQESVLDFMPLELSKSYVRSTEVFTSP